MDAKKNIVNVDRDDVLDGGYRAFSRKTFQRKALLSVRFSAEDGIDTSGLTREFLRLCLHDMHDSCLFEGKENKRFLALDYKALEKGMYENAGRIMAYSLVHRGPIPSFLHPQQYIAISQGLEKVEVSIEDINNVEIQLKLKAIQDSTDEESFHLAVNSVENLVMVAGCASMCQKINSDLVTRLCHFTVLGRSSMAIQQLQKGLQYSVFLTP